MKCCLPNRRDTQRGGTDAVEGGRQGVAWSFEGGLWIVTRAREFAAGQKAAYHGLTVVRPLVQVGRGRPRS